MPKRKIIKKDFLDKFYTNPIIAKICIEKLKGFITADSSDEFILIEPSAGNGSFSNQINCIALDIEPEASDFQGKSNEHIIHQDFLSYIIPKGNVCIFGNPPFGERNSLSKAFITHSLNSAKIIAFILPEVFDKVTYQKIFPTEWCLVDKLDLPDKSFLLNQQSYHVPCVFQIWVKKDLLISRNWKGNDLRKTIITRSETDDFSIVSKHENPKIDIINRSDLFVFGASPKKYIEPNLVMSNNRGYYIKATGINIDEIKKNLSAIDWRKYGKSSVNGGVFWLTKTEFILAYENGKQDIFKENYNEL